jgi:hypothetical protein
MQMRSNGSLLPSLTMWKARGVLWLVARFVLWTATDECWALLGVHPEFTGTFDPRPFPASCHFCRESCPEDEKGALVSIQNNQLRWHTRPLCYVLSCSCSLPNSCSKIPSWITLRFLCNVNPITSRLQLVADSSVHTLMNPRLGPCSLRVRVKYYATIYTLPLRASLLKVATSSHAPSWASVGL